MYYNMKKKLEGILDSVSEMLEYFKIRNDMVDTYVGECIEVSKVVIEVINNNYKAYDLSKLNQIIRILELEETELIDNLDFLLQLIVNIKDDIDKNIPTRWQMVFLPYNPSMWTALKSIWEEAEADPRCDAYVIPIPYATFTGEKEGSTINYLGNSYPEEVPIIDYRKISLEEMNPEFIYIHNPYDEYNNLTQVPECFYSKNLRNFTDNLVYSPYFTFFTGDKEANKRLTTSAAVYYSDYVIVQSDKVKRIFVENGHKEDKFLTLGSPKIDAIYKMKEVAPIVPKHWMEKLKDRKVILYTFSLAAASNEEWMKAIVYYMKQYWKDPDVGFIFRPHPLVREYCKGRNLNVKLLDEIFEIAENNERFVLDTSEDYIPAFYFSDGFMLSDTSSLINEYLVTGKPIYWDNPDFDVNQQIKEVKDTFPVDTTLLYCPHSVNGIMGVEQHEKGVFDFFQVIKSGNDPKKNERIKMINNAFFNSNGTAGKKIYDTLVNEMLQS